MSLIIDINPVPWKILDLVRARILKNRAKKAKKGVDWSKETMKREMSLQPGPLSRRKRDEPSFIPSGRFVTYTIEGVRRYFTISGSVQGNRKRIRTSWTIFVEWEGQETQPEGRDKQPILRVESGNDTDYDLDFSGPNVDTVYISQFESLETGDEGSPLFIFSNAVTSLSFSQFTGRAASAFSITPPFDLDNFPATNYNSFSGSPTDDYQIADFYFHPSIAWGYEAAIMSTSFNPLQAWTLAPYVAPSPNIKNSAAASTTSNPLENEYDTSIIQDAPGYMQTESLSFPDGSCPTGFVDSGVIYEAHVTTPPWGFSSSIYTEIVAASPPQVSGGSNWSITWTSLHGEQKSYSRDLYPPDSVWSDPFRPLGPAGPPPYVVLQYVKQIGTVKDCMISKTVEP